MPPFVFNSRYVLLTYAQCGDLDGFRVMDRISELGGECIVGRESHDDGGLHLHVFCDFERKFRSRKTDVFDVGGFHPNVSKSYGTPEKGYDYAIKDGDVLCGGLARPSGAGDGKTDSAWVQIAAARDRDEFWRLCRELAPKALITSYTSLRAYADWEFRPVVAEYESPRGAIWKSGDCDGRDQWLAQSGISSERSGARRKSLILYGRSQTGKTSWARSLGKHIYCVGLMSGAELKRSPDVEYAVFDDMRGGMRFFHGWKEWLGCQPWVSVKELYREPKLVPWGKVGIFCCNRDPRLDMQAEKSGFFQEDVDWLEENCMFIECNEKIVEFP